MRLAPDKRLRDRLFVPESYSHPAKGHLGLWEAIIQKYTKPGDWIVDPMAGVGSTLIAALMGRHVICVELEQHFIEPMKASWEKMRQTPMLGHELGKVLILRGDARCLPFGSAQDKPLGNGADCVVSSPPYANRLRDEGDDQHRHWPVKDPSKYMTRYTRPQGSADGIITSPPWEDSITAERLEVPPSAEQKDRQANWVKQGKGPAYQGYTRPASPERRPEPDEGPRVDAVVSSPPYAEGLGHDVGRDREIDQRKKLYSARGQAAYAGPSTQNIGNLRGAAYWDAMKLVYQECHRVLKSEGIMVLVLKGFTRDGKYVDLPSDTKTLAESLGFKLFDRWARELWSLSFWRILQRRRDPEAFDERLRFEEVLAFRKLEGEGSVDAVVTSPPYEALRQDGGVNDLSLTKRDFHSYTDGITTKGHESRQRHTRPRGSIDSIVTSPPYEEGLGHGAPIADPVDVKKKLYSGMGRYGYTRRG